MNLDQHLMLLLQDIHVPLEDPHAPDDWKEWYHFVLMHPPTGARLLGNVSLSGVPGRGQIIVTVLASLPPGLGRDAPIERTFGFCSDYEWGPGMVQRAPVRVEGPDFLCVLDGPSFRFEARDREKLIDLTIEGHAATTPLVIPEFSPFGSGFIGWGLVPEVEAHGTFSWGEDRLDIGPDWYGYHDHNYGRFRWGEDIGWIWFVVAADSAAGERQTLILHRGNNRDQTKMAAPYLFVYEGNELRKVFMGAAVHLDWRWTPDRQRPPRLPGGMASLFADRTLRLPESLKLRAADEKDNLALDLEVSSVVEIVLADNRHRQYTFIEEMTGEAVVDSRLGGHSQTAKGNFYAEFVH